MVFFDHATDCVAMALALQREAFVTLLGGSRTRVPRGRQRAST